MKNDPPAGRPKPKSVRSVACSTSDREFDHGARPGCDHESLLRRWRAEEIEQEGGLRADVYRSLGLM